MCIGVAGQEVVWHQREASMPSLPTTESIGSPIHSMRKYVSSSTTPMGIREVQKLRGPIIGDMSFRMCFRRKRMSLHGLREES